MPSRKRELNSFESKIAGVLVTGIDSGAARSVVPAGEIPGYPVERDSETGRVYTSATGERVFDQGKQQILGTVDGKVRGLNMRVAQVKKSLTSVYDMCAAGHRVVFDFDSNKRDLSHAENKLTGETDVLQVAKPCVGARSQHHPESGNGGHPDKDARAECRGVVSFRGAGTLAVSPEDLVGSGPVRDDREREGRGVMAEATAHHEVPADHDPACEPSEPGRARRTDEARKRRSQCRGSRAVPELVQGMCGWTRSKRRTPDFEIVRERNHNDWYRLRVPGRQGDIGRAGGRTFSDPGHEVVDHAGDDCRCAPVQGHSASLVCAGFGTSDCGNG